MNDCQESHRFDSYFSQCVIPAKMKWKVPLYVGIPPSQRNGHTAFILHSHVSVKFKLKMMMMMMTMIIIILLLYKINPFSVFIWLTAVCIWRQE